MIPFKEKPNTAVLLILLCFSGSCFSFLQETRRKVDGPFSEYHRQASLKDEPRKIVNHEREVIVVSPYIRDVGADSRQSRIDARDIRTDFREIRTELGRDTVGSDRRTQNRDSRRSHDIDQSNRILLDNSRSREVRSSDSRERRSSESNNIRFSERRDARLDREDFRRNVRFSDDRRTSTPREYRLSQEDSRRNLHHFRFADTLPNNIRYREVRGDDRSRTGELREYRLEREDSRRTTESRRNKFEHANNNVRTREASKRSQKLDQEVSRRHLNDIRFRESRNGGYSAERRTGFSGERRDNTLDQDNSRMSRNIRNNDDENSRRTLLDNSRSRDVRTSDRRTRQFRSDRESSRRNLLDNTRSREIHMRTRSRELRERNRHSSTPRERIEFRTDGERSRKNVLNNIRSRDSQDRSHSADRRASARREYRNGLQENARRRRLDNITSREGDERRTRHENSRNNIKSEERERRELRSDQENSRRLNIRARVNRRISSSERRQNGFDPSNSRTTSSDVGERRYTRENLLSNDERRLSQNRDTRMGDTSSRRNSRGVDQVHFRRNSLNGGSFRFGIRDSREKVISTIRTRDDKKNDTGSRFTRNTGNTRVVTENHNFIPSFNNYKSNILVTIAQAALVILLFGQILGNASKNKLRLTNWRAIFSKEKMA